MNASEQLAQVRALYLGTEAVQEGGKTLAFIPNITVTTSDGPVTFDALLYPYAHPTGYTTRLFVSRQLRAPNAANWTSHQLCGQTWWVCSWNQVPASLTWVEILANHLKAFRCS